MDALVGCRPSPDKGLERMAGISSGKTPILRSLFLRSMFSSSMLSFEQMNWWFINSRLCSFSLSRPIVASLALSLSVQRFNF